MTQTFYRLHTADQEFSADNAWSAQWGVTWDATGTRHECMSCDGTGGSLTDADQECDECDGEGWVDAARGYSCCWTADELVAYMRVHGVVEDHDPVVIFEGTRVGTGMDGEPLAVPTGAVRWTTWADLRTES